jgi:hypothetical protein
MRIGAKYAIHVPKTRQRNASLGLEEKGAGYDSASEDGCACDPRASPAVSAEKEGAEDMCSPAESMPGESSP